MRNLRIRQLLLLLLRILIILLLVISFARPTLRNGSGGLLAERSPIEAVIILDNSLSLNEVRLTGSLLENLRQAFSALESVFQNGDRITVVQATIPKQILVNKESYQSGIWERVLQKLQPNYLKSDLDNAVFTAVGHLKESLYAAKEIYLISDFQKFSLKSPKIKGILAGPEFQNIKLFAIPISHENYENVSVDSVEVINRLIEINQPVTIKAYLRNHHPENYLNILTSAILNNNRVAQQKVNLAPGQISVIEFRLTLTENGFVQGRIETEGDAILEDNRRYFNFYVPKKIKILHIVPQTDFDTFLPLIVQPARNRGIFDYQSEPVANWASRNFSNFDMIICEGLNQIGETLMLRLKHFVDQGGSILIIPGGEIVIPQYQKLFKQFSLGNLLARRGTPGSAEQFLSLQEFQWNHPIFEGLFENRERNLNPIEVYAGYYTRPGKNAETLIRLSDQSPFLIQRTIKKGVVFFLTSPVHPDWSQLPLKGFVVPLMYRMIYFAGTQKISDRQNVRCGELFQQQYSNLEAPFNFKITGSQELEIKLNPRFRGSNVFLEFRDTELPENYRIWHNDRLLGSVSVNVWKEESQLIFYDEDELKAILPDVFYFENINDLAEQVQLSRFGEELWKYFLILALVFLFLEMIIARTGSFNQDYS